MMYGKMKDKMPMKGSKGDSSLRSEESVMEKKKPMAGIEIEIEGDESEPEGEESLSEASAEEEEVSVGELAKFSDEELKAELEKRGMSVASEASAEGPSTSESESEEPMPVLKKKPAKV